MNRKVLLPVVLVAVFALSLVPRAQTVIHEESFLPPNNLSIPIGSQDDKGITKPQFEAVMDQIQAIYGPVVAARGGKLVINRLWSDNTVNASAQRNGNNYVLNMYGGLARHESITQDGMALVACHEMGHHIGGAPKYARMDWASNEGQADYFANLKCLRILFAREGAQSFSRAALDDAQPRAACAQAYVSPAEQAICVRTAVAGMSVTTLLRILRNETVLPRYDTPDPKVVAKMDDNHPATQCRLDTYFSASLCARPVGDALDEKAPAPGTCTRSQGYTTGLRPRCWYKPPANEPVGMSDTLAVRSSMIPKNTETVSALNRPDLWKGL